MLKRFSLFAGVTALSALSFTAVSGLVQDNRAVPVAVVRGPSAEALAAAYPQAWAMHKAYGEFREGPDWHGAFAVGSGGAFGGVSGYADPEVSRRDALAQCSAWADDCRTIAEIIPGASLSVALPEVSGPQAEALIALQRARGGIRAFAVDKRGHWGGARGFSTPDEASARALSQCRAAQAADHAPDRLGFPCKLVWVSG